jgi:hypothetical protein
MGRVRLSWSRELSTVDGHHWCSDPIIAALHLMAEGPSIVAAWTY